MLFVLRMFYFFKKDRDFACSFFSGKLILSAAGPTVDSLFFGQVEIASGKLILATVGPTDRLLKKLISTPNVCSFVAVTCFSAIVCVSCFCGR